MDRPRRLILQSPFGIKGSNRNSISYGLIVHAASTQRWAVVQRKHSVAFLIYIRGGYRPSQLPILLSTLIPEEANLILKCLAEGSATYKRIYLEELDLDPGGLQLGLIRMRESRGLVSSFLSRADLSLNQLEWTWPRGRPIYKPDGSKNETPLECACREFEEEVQIQLPPALYLSDSPLIIQIKTLSGRSIEVHHWIYLIPEEIVMTPPQTHPEVAARCWVDTSTGAALLGLEGPFETLQQIVAPHL